MEKTMNLSAALEDYLETIFVINQKEGSAHISDIARKLNVAASSVNEVINKLSDLKLVDQEKYGPVTLTNKGKKYAKKISCKHNIIKNFLINILNVNKKVAEKDACMMEHVVSSVTMERLIDFLLNTNNIDIDNVCLNDYIDNSAGQQSISSLNKLSVNDSGSIIKITAKGNNKKRLLDMGLIPGTEVKVKRKAPLGDPLEISVKGDNLSLRKEETRNIYIKKK